MKCGFQTREERLGGNQNHTHTEYGAAFRKGETASRQLTPLPSQSRNAEQPVEETSTTSVLTAHVWLYGGVLALTNEFENTYQRAGDRHGGTTQPRRSRQ